MKKKFKIMYPCDYHEPDKRGKPYKPQQGSMVVMNGGGCFFLFSGDDYNSYIRPLREVLPKYDVIWK